MGFGVDNSSGFRDLGGSMHNSAKDPLSGFHTASIRASGSLSRGSLNT